MNLMAIKQENPRLRRLPGASAFTIVEAVFGMLILGMLSLAVYGGIAQGFKTIQLSREGVRATQVLQDRLETIRLFTWSKLNSTNHVIPTFRVPLNAGQNQGPFFEGTTKVSPPSFSETYSDDLRLITVKLTWTSGGRRFTKELSSLVAHTGLNDYIH